MFNLLKRDTPSAGSVLFRGNLPPRAEEFDFLTKAGVELERDQAANAYWALKMRHRQWGEAHLVCLKDAPAPPAEAIDYSTGLSDEERTEAKAGKMSVTVRAPAAKKNALRDRKNMFRYLRAVMSDDGVVAADHTSMRFWSRSALDEELLHDADLDISSLYCIHAVTRDEEGTDDASVYWLHTHGLEGVGAFDFDILEPSNDAIGSIDDMLRAMAFAIVEGAVKPDTASFALAHPEPTVRLVPAAEFDRLAGADERALRDAPEDHTKNRAVLCEPAKGMFAKWSKGVKASKFFKTWDGGDLVIHFSKTSTALMAERARNTMNLLKSMMDEFHDLELPVLAKIGYKTDNGGGAGQEHLWFTVHGIDGEMIDGTLENEPFEIAAMKAGDRGEHPIEQLTDWAIMSPAGQINPRSLWPARLVRTHREEIKSLIQKMKEEGQA